MFCYLADMKSYAKWFSHLDAANNPWLWGMDLILTKHMGLRAGLLQMYSMRHHYQSTFYDTATGFVTADATASVPEPVARTHNASEDFDKYITKFGETRESLSQQPNTLYWVHVNGQT